MVTILPMYNPTESFLNVITSSTVKEYYESEIGETLTIKPLK